MISRLSSSLALLTLAALAAPAAANSLTISNFNVTNNIYEGVTATFNIVLQGNKPVSSVNVLLATQGTSAQTQAPGAIVIPGTTTPIYSVNLGSYAPVVSDGGNVLAYSNLTPFTYTQDGTYSVSLSGSATVGKDPNVAINNPYSGNLTVLNEAPTFAGADLSDAQVNVGDAWNFETYASDDGTLDDLSFQWKFYALSDTGHTNPLAIVNRAVNHANANGKIRHVKDAALLTSLATGRYSIDRTVSDGTDTVTTSAGSLAIVSSVPLPPAALAGGGLLLALAAARKLRR